MISKYRDFVPTLAMIALLLGACAPQPTLDSAAISTNAAQTVEARFTQQATSVTATPEPATLTPIPQLTATESILPTMTLDPALPTPTSNGKACYVMTFLSDVTIPDGMIVTPGSKFTKTWQVRNDGNCPWDQKYSLALAQGDGMGAPTSIPLTAVVLPGQTTNLSIDFIAPTTEGVYTGYWHLATPYGGFIGVGSYNQSLIVKINSTSKTNGVFGAVSVTYDYTRDPVKGCTSDGAFYNFTANITVNGPGTIRYRWDHNPFDGVVVGGTLKFTEAGSKTVSWTWHMTTDHVQGIDRWVMITAIVDNTDKSFDKVLFNYTCAK